MTGVSHHRSAANAGCVAFYPSIVRVHNPPRQSLGTGLLWCQLSGTVWPCSASSVVTPSDSAFPLAFFSPRLNLRELGPWASHMRWLVWIMASTGTVYVFFFHER